MRRVEKCACGLTLAEARGTRHPTPKLWQKCREQSSEYRLRYFLANAAEALKPFAAVFNAMGATGGLRHEDVVFEVVGESSVQRVLVRDFRAAAMVYVEADSVRQLLEREER